MATTETVKDLTTPTNIFHDLSATRYKIWGKMDRQY